MEIQDTLREYIQTRIVIDRDASAIDANTPLIGSFLDSLDILRLVVFLEERFGVSVADEELVPENFQTIARIAAFVEQKRSPK